MTAPISERYRRFATMEASESSPLYEELALAVADDPELLGFLAGLPRAKQQPNLFFAATRFVAGTPDGFAAFRQAVLDNRSVVADTMLTRLTQTNEPARCAALRPLLATLPQPLALIEVGASAGLCLLPDRYAYDYDGRQFGGGDPVLFCSVEGTGPPVDAPIDVAWRTGIDLNPLDVTDPEDVLWLETLVWPEQTERLDRLRAAIATATADPPPVVRGDLNECLADVAADAPAGATLVVYHTAVLNYLTEADRDRFTSTVGRLGARWISQEGYGALPAIGATPTSTATFILALDGRAVAYTAPHGGWIRWITS